MNISPNIVEVSVQNFQAEVVERSKQVPVFLEFYARGAAPSEALAPILKKLVDEFKGKIVLARVDVQAYPQIAQQLGVRGLPTIKVISEGHMAHELEGPQTEEGLRDIIEQLTLSPVERFREQIKLLLSTGNRGDAIRMLQDAIGAEPHNYALHVELADLMVMEGRIDEARQILATLPADTEGMNKPKNRIEFIERSTDLPDVATLESLTTENPDELRNFIQLAVRLIADDQIEPALEALLTVLKKDKSFDDEIARKTMIKIFEMLGKGDPIATAYRRKMFTFLH